MSTVGDATAVATMTAVAIIMLGGRLDSESV